MALNSIISFIEENSSNIEECLLTPLSNELQVICEILSKDEIKSQISACLEELDVKANNCTLKSEAESNTYREEGNRLFRENKKANALAASRYYTNAILAAPEDSPVLALAHANRAAALVEFGYYFDAYSDCEIAKNLGYPKEKQLKIIMRQAYCAVKLKNYNHLENALEKLRDMPLNEQCLNQKEDFEEKLKILAELPGKWHQDQPRDYKVQNIRPGKRSLHDHLERL
ncbi:uncharacterized protein LOC129918966 [Episyrphus balteatus]|uniref:uncharacterized protein LOC129918966 n=1 Tax=Episyrphus balteatus TaxID=286459 RepID=UPI002486B588|nr:uncharacterized protein LOC129918966 [Episyrphus balteatus]